MGDLLNMDLLKSVAEQVPNLVVLVYLVRMFIKAHQSQLQSSERMEERHRETMKEIVQESAVRETHMQGIVERNTNAYIKFSERLNKLIEEK